MTIRASFSRLALSASYVVGTWQAFVAATALILIWILGGFYYGFSSDSYQLIINTGTSVITFLMVFLIQCSQNRDTLALHIKIDELIHAIPVARDEIKSIETMSEDELHSLRQSSHG